MREVEDSPNRCPECQRVQITNEVCSECIVAPSEGEVTAVSLADCPVGLFWHGDELCFKTEYGNNEGKIDAYIVSSGEFYWGDAPQTIASQRAQMVRPVDTDFAISALQRALPAPQREVERLRPWLKHTLACLSQRDLHNDTECRCGLDDRVAALTTSPDTKEALDGQS